MRQWRAAALFSAFILLHVATGPASVAQAAPSRELTIEAIVAPGGLTGRAPESIQWSPDGSKVSWVQRDQSGEHGELYYLDAATGQKAVLVSAAKLSTLAPSREHIQSEIRREWVERYHVAAYHWAPDSKHLLFDANGQLWYYSLDNGTALQETSSPDESTDPKFSPDGKRFAFIRKHDLWVRDLGADEEHPVTTGGDDDLLNGEVDWVYEEELRVRSNYFWSPNGKEIAFLQMNEKTVPSYPIVDWTPVDAHLTQEKYPKPGDINPEVRLGVVGSGGGHLRWISVGDPQDWDVYIPRFGWVRDGLLWVDVLNRAQTRLDLYFVDTSKGHSKLVMTENEPVAWIEDGLYDAIFLRSGNQFLWRSWRDGHVHVYLYRFDSAHPLAGEAQLQRQLTQGEFEVSGISGLDEDSGTLFVTANKDDPRRQAIYSVKLAGGPLEAVTPQPGTHTASFPESGGKLLPAKYFVDDFSDPKTPPRYSFCRVGGSCTPIWDSLPVSQYGLIEPVRLVLKAADGVTTLYATLLLPPGAKDAAARGKLPLILNPYGGPGVQMVHDAWGGSGYLFNNILAKHGFGVLTVDNRGMAGRGKAFAAALRRHFGRAELADQLAALDQVLQRYPQFDPSRTGFYGASYGGYFTLYAMTHTDRIRAGVSISPVTNWRLYDSIYTERYMGLPKDNEAGYNDSSPVNQAANLHGRLLEIHGTSDDHVHLQNTIQMVGKLIAAGKQFDLELYPNQTHGIGQAGRAHLDHLILDFLERELGVSPAPEKDD